MDQSNRKNMKKSKKEMAKNRPERAMRNGHLSPIACSPLPIAGYIL